MSGVVMRWAIPVTTKRDPPRGIADEMGGGSYACGLIFGIIIGLTFEIFPEREGHASSCPDWDRGWREKGIRRGRGFSQIGGPAD